MQSTAKNLPKLSQDQTMSISGEGLNYILSNLDPLNPSKNFLWTTDYKVELPIRVKKQGYGSEKPQIIPEMFKRTVQRFGDRGALNYQKAPNKWVTINYKEYYNLCKYFAQALITLQIKQFSTINIIGFNCCEWAISFFGSILGHYVPIGLYTTNNPQACQYIANHSECQVVLCQNVNQLSKYMKIIQNIQKVKYFILFKGEVPIKQLPQQMKNKVLTWQNFIKIGKAQYSPQRKQDELQQRIRNQKPGNCCTFIYTSGTTGPPKAVMISHDNYTWVAKCVVNKFNLAPSMQGQGRVLSMLPLSHVAAQLVDLILPIKGGYSVFFPDQSILQGTLVQYLTVCRPTVLLLVPRIWQKVQDKLISLGSQTTGLKKKIADWAKCIGPIGTNAQINNKSMPNGWSFAEKMVFNKIKQALGIDKVKVFMTGAAPIKQSTRLFYLKLNIFIYNVYGMSETTGPHVWTNPKLWNSFQTTQFLKQAGQTMLGTDLAISNPDQEGHGQVCMRGRNSFMGYFKSEEQTKNTIDDKGFVHSGDIGVLDKNENLSITGRIKELIITAGGQNVAPILIQNQINTKLPIFSHSIVVGDKQKFLGVLLCLKMKDKQNLLDEVVQYFQQNGSSAKKINQAMKCQIVRKIINEGIQKANQKAISRAQKVQRFIILPEQLSIQKGTLTPTMKVKRKIVYSIYKDFIEMLYTQSKL